MPTPELMTWIAAQRRWTKMYAGRRYYISARKLNCPETKSDSLQAANQWWRDKQADLDLMLKSKAAKDQRRPQPMDDLFATSHGIKPYQLESVKELLERVLVLEEEKRKLAPQQNVSSCTVDVPIQSLSAREEEDYRREKIIGVIGDMLFQGDTPETALLPPERAESIAKSLETIRGVALHDPASCPIGELVEKWLDRHRIRARCGEISPTRFNTIRTCIAHFCAFAGPSNALATINANLLESFHSYCLSKIGDRRGGEPGFSEDRAKQVLDIAKMFARWLWEHEKIELPRNLASLKIRVPTKPIVTWTIDEVKLAISETKSPLLKVSMLMMINCGMTQKDVSDLADNEVDWKKGVVTRRRSKAARYKNAPTVQYPLWSDAFRLLKAHRSGTPRVLLLKSGRPMVRNEIKDGKLSGADMLVTKFRKLRERLGISKTLKQLRKTSASILKSHRDFGQLATLFLGHSPSSIADKHYTKPPQELLNEAIGWLGEQYGFHTPRDASSA